MDIRSPQEKERATVYTVCIVMYLSLVTPSVWDHIWMQISTLHRKAATFLLRLPQWVSHSHPGRWSTFTVLHNGTAIVDVAECERQSFSHRVVPSIKLLLVAAVIQHWQGEICQIPYSMVPVLLYSCLLKNNSSRIQQRVAEDNGWLWVRCISWRQERFGTFCDLCFLWDTAFFASSVYGLLKPCFCTHLSSSRRKSYIFITLPNMDILRK